MSHIDFLLHQKQGSHIWNFSTVGGEKRVNLDSGTDLLHLAELDPKLWTALSCPVNNLEIDKGTLDLIDTDNDGQIRIPEVVAAVQWVTGVLKDPGELLKEAATFPLSAINDGTDEGRMLLETARIIAKNLGKAHENSLEVGETSDTEKIYAGTKFNGDGVITEDTTTTAEELQLLQEIMACVASIKDRNGKPGVNQELVDLFVAQCEQYDGWIDKRDNEYQVIMPLGGETEQAYNHYCSIRSKVDDYFIRCRLAAFDDQATEVLNLQTARVELITDKDLSTCMDDIAAYPIAKIAAGRPLPLTNGINPAWEKAIHQFRSMIATVLLQGKEEITEQEWENIGNQFAPFAGWMANKQGAIAEPLGIARVREILSTKMADKLTALILKDKELEQEANNIMQVDKLVRYHRDIFRLLKNFVTFYDFYTPGIKAIFQAGTLYIDQRSCDLCVKVSDMPKHATNASFSGMYLIYCDCVLRSTNEKMTIVAALTNGDVNNLNVGRNALFYDRRGLDWDATVVKIIENPISIRQAFFSPYNKVSKFIETQVNKFASSADEKVSSGLTKSVTDIPVKEEDEKAKKEPPPPFDVGKFVGIFAAIGLAVGAIGTALASVVGGFLGLVWWKMPIAIAGLLLVISGPSMIIAFFKLRKRNLAPLLDANGWAINARVIVNIQFGNALTHLAELPKGAKINFNDPFTKKSRPVLPVVLFLSIVAGIIIYVLWKNKFMSLHF